MFEWNEECPGWHQSLNGSLLLRNYVFKIRSRTLSRRESVTVPCLCLDTRQDIDGQHPSPVHFLFQDHLRITIEDGELAFDMQFPDSL